ncbi:39S ribosomal protein L48 [Nibea albiflora]|uniref:39S ribosomal protein L48 n=1 Tax=Nibea albiflora TaxID=240163 RepID=A0ACB7EUT5_NIBAL|nr:39S ribosomal protein L48 [Nibea albiflora]
MTNVANEVINLYTAGSRTTSHQNTVLLLVNSEQILKDLEDRIMNTIAEQEIVTRMPVVIFLSCIRKVSVAQNVKNVVLKDELSDTEKQKFDEKKKELSLKYKDKCEQFHGFNIMQTNFSEDYVEQACEVFSSDRRTNRSRNTQLVACLSLLNDYVPGSYLTESQCLDFLKHEDDSHGDLEVKMEPFSHLITFQQDERSGKKVRMAHRMIAQQCTDLMSDEGVTRSDTAINFLTCLCSKRVPPYLLGFVKDMLTKRGTKKEENPISGTTTEEEWFSRLILDIKENEGSAKSASVLEEASEQFDKNPFFPQALARFYYIELNDYNLAEMWAEQAKDRDPQNSFVADTLGQVYKKHLKSLKESSEIQKIAKEAIKAFKHAERLAENEIKEHGTTKVFNTAGMLGCLEIYNHCQIKNNNFLNDLLSRDEVEQKCTFLEKYVIYSKPAMMKNYATKISKATECYRSYVGGSQPKQFKQTDTSFIQRLKQILDDTSTVVLSCLDTESKVKKITTWWEEIFQRSSSKSEPKMPLDHKDKPELHLVSLLLCWPTDGEVKCEILSQVIQCMHDSYKHAYEAYFRSRYLRPLFFIGKGQGLDRIVHRKVLEGLFPEGNEETEEDWSNDKIFHDPMVQERLLKVEGVVRKHRIYATIDGKEIKVEANLRKSLWRARQVSFYLGFTIRGPVAFGIQTRNRTNEVVSEMDISDPGPSTSEQTDIMRALKSSSYIMPPKKKKDRQQMKSIMAATETAYGTLNVKVSGFDMTMVEHYSQYIHNLCNRFGIKVAECYALPTKTTEVMLMQEQGTKMYVDSILKTHERVVQLSSLNAALCPVFMEVVLKNQPEGVQLSVKEHTEADFHSRFKARPELEGLIAQMGD